MLTGGCKWNIGGAGKVPQTKKNCFWKLKRICVFGYFQGNSNLTNRWHHQAYEWSLSTSDTREHNFDKHMASTMLNLKTVVCKKYFQFEYFHCNFFFNFFFLLHGPKKNSLFKRNKHFIDVFSFIKWRWRFFSSSFQNNTLSMQ